MNILHNFIVVFFLLASFNIPYSSYQQNPNEEQIERIKIENELLKEKLNDLQNTLDQKLQYQQDVFNTILEDHHNNIEHIINTNSQILEASEQFHQRVIWIGAFIITVVIVIFALYYYLFYRIQEISISFENNRINVNNNY